MKLTIFAPGTKSSAIGKVAALVCRALAHEGHQFNIVLTENWDNPDDPRHDFGVPARHWSDRQGVETVLSMTDMAVHHIGDNYQLHRGSLEWLPRAKGIVCLHDFFLASLFLGWSAGRQEAAAEIVERWYGPHSAEAFFGSRDSGRFVESTHLTAPMTEWLAEMAEAMVTHSSWGAGRVLSACAGPIRIVPLPYEIRETGKFPTSSSHLAADKDVILTVGHINRNKRPESVILAIAGSSILRKRVVYQLIGSIEPSFAGELSILAKRAEVMLDLRGVVTDDVLDAAIDRAQIVSCLRRPVLEAASASAIEAMLHGKPIIVSNAGFYQDIPDNCVVKIAPEREVADLRSALERLHFDAVARQDLGDRARVWARQTFVASNYARELVGVAQDVLSARPVVSMLQHFASIASHWSDDPAAMLNADALHRIDIFADSDGVSMR